MSSIVIIFRVGNNGCSQILGVFLERRDEFMFLNNRELISSGNINLCAPAFCGVTADPLKLEEGGYYILRDRNNRNSVTGIVELVNAPEYLIQLEKVVVEILQIWTRKPNYYFRYSELRAGKKIIADVSNIYERKNV